MERALTCWTDLTGHVSIVTGGNAGIGLGLARGLVGAGASVAIWGTNSARNAAAVEALTALGAAGDAAAFTVDVSDQDAVEDGVVRTLERFGHLSSCFANAGISGRPDRIERLSEDDWRNTLAVNLDGVFFTLRAVSRQLRSQDTGGSLVVTSSLGAIDGMARFTPYSASKGAALSLVRSLAVELGGDGIRVNAVLPGFTDTAMTDEHFGADETRRRISSRIPLRRWATPEDFEAIAVFLAGPGSAYLTAQTIVIDGGYSVF